ncbi:ubiquinol-cytochrome-c reductase complex subunit 6 [Coprinopsis sp. MPI-PUGE-AT-0042]|nr:ubiquinol-cytochrome-c reductase complex subunit 6 [Coprinopsis sp. MPI-PUGE-AT-0042]
MFGPLSSKSLYKWVKPFANWYADATRYRQYGFKYDDLLMEENDTVQRAITRLTPREGYDRAYRFKRASQCSLLHKALPKEQWTKPEEDVRYLAPHVINVDVEQAERQKWDHVIVKRS